MKTNFIYSQNNTMLLKDIKKKYTPEDRKIMKDNEKYLKVYDVTNWSIHNVKNAKRVDKRKARKDIWDEDYYTWLYRSTFHYSCIRFGRNKEYAFINPSQFCF